MLQGNVLIFLDAHIECTEGWLRPILSRIASDRSVVVVPIIDAIDSDNMSYYANDLAINAIRWHLMFGWYVCPTLIIWIELKKWTIIKAGGNSSRFIYRMQPSERELLRTKNDRTAPLRTPTHVGCAFAIDREFFFEIGSYDEGMDIWGSENVELAFRVNILKYPNAFIIIFKFIIQKVWMCGGALEVLPCSRVGHLYRISTYSFNGDQSEIKARNNFRLIEVWMDEFKDYIYTANPGFFRIWN